MHWTISETGFVPPPRRADVVVHELDDEAILVDPRNGSTYRLNRTALTIWRECDGNTDTRSMADRPTAQYGVDFDTALDDIEQVVVVLMESGLLAPRSRP